MKKVFLVALIPVILLLCGCVEDNVTDEVKDNYKTIELYDKELGYRTTFTYDEISNYSKVDIDDEKENVGKSTSIEFDNDSLDVEFDMYFVDMDTNNYDTVKNSHIKDKYYKEYAFGIYEGYSFGNSEDSLELYVVLRNDKKSKINTVLYTIINRLDDDEKVIVSDVFDGKELQTLFNSITFKKENVKEDKKENVE